MQWVAAAGATRAGLAATLSLLKWPLITAWICTAVGLGGRLPPILTGLGVAVFVGCSKSCAAPVNHTWDVTMAALLACGFLCRPDRWSLDHAISRHFPRWPYKPFGTHAGDLSGYARKLVLLFAVYSLSAAGVAKMCNGVRQGLAAALFSRSPAHQARFLDQARAGILKLNLATADADAEAPFGGWKASGIGPPEHGRSNREFYTRAQAVYS
jgi:hypothetical protein